MEKKEVKVQLTVSYDKIRQVMCMMDGKVFQDSEIKEMVGNDVLNLETDLLENQKDEMETLVSVMILIKVAKKKEALQPKKKSKFQERLEAMQEMQKNKQ